jgi:hypothetical protein
MGEQLQHVTSSPGAPCQRCGLRYSMKTSYVPCFEQGDTYDSWYARQDEAVQALVRKPPAGDGS